MNTFYQAWAEVVTAQQLADAAIQQLNRALGTATGHDINIPQTQARKNP